MSEVRSLEPKTVWNHFEDLNAVPRPSKKEERIIQFMLDFGNSLGLETINDHVGNVIIKKPASKGFENRKTVILQAHIDMVHQKNEETDFDFDTEGIRSYVDGDWVKAEGTTLGADNGMGVASIMAVLSSENIDHPAIEALFTIDEETGMTGAKGLEAKNLTGEILLNLDTEDDDELSIGCAGGVDTNVKYECETRNTPEGFSGVEIVVKGLKGGHSGMDIHLGRANSNKVMNRLLFSIDKSFNLSIHSIDGGSLRNAIPRESKAVVAIDQNQVNEAQAFFEEQVQSIKEEFSITEPNMEILWKAVEIPSEIVSEEDQQKILNSIQSVYNGVYRMSDAIPGLVETSTSLARVELKNGVFETQSLQRSSVESGKVDVANTVGAAFTLMGAEVEHAGDYPGWTPNPESEILKITEAKYKEMFNEAPQVKACHAGLECGILSKALPGVDMISFGPTIMHPHSPDEKVSISSVQKFWGYFLEILKLTPEKD